MSEEVNPDQQIEATLSEGFPREISREKLINMLIEFGLTNDQADETLSEQAIVYHAGVNKSARSNCLFGLLIGLASILATTISFNSADVGGTASVYVGAIVAGFIQFLRGVGRMEHASTVQTKYLIKPDIPKPKRRELTREQKQLRNRQLASIGVACVYPVVVAASWWMFPDLTIDDPPKTPSAEVTAQPAELDLPFDIDAVGDASVRLIEEVPFQFKLDNVYTNEGRWDAEEFTLKIHETALPGKLIGNSPRNDWTPAIPAFVSISIPNSPRDATPRAEFDFKFTEADLYRPLDYSAFGRIFFQGRTGISSEEKRSTGQFFLITKPDLLKIRKWNHNFETNRRQCAMIGNFNHEISLRNGKCESISRTASLWRQIWIPLLIAGFAAPYLGFRCLPVDARNLTKILLAGIVVFSIIPAGFLTANSFRTPEQLSPLPLPDACSIDSRDQQLAYERMWPFKHVTF